MEPRPQLDAELLLTSNYPADELLPDPLFHHTMVPVIEMIRSNLTEWRIPDGVDYRTLNTGAGGELVATFAQLCGVPASVQDYLGLARTFSRWRLLEVPAPEEIDDQASQRFAFLVDVLVDADLCLDVEASLPLADWARAERLPRDAGRFLSRLSLLTSA